MKVAVFPGSFDPLTLGHLDLIKRGSALFDQLAVAVMTNTSKKPLFSVEERIQQIKEATAGLDNVSVITASGLTVDLMNRIGADYLMRGLRNNADFQYERDIAAMNNFLDDQCETIFFLQAGIPAPVEQPAEGGHLERGRHLRLPAGKHQCGTEEAAGRTSINAGEGA